MWLSLILRNSSLIVYGIAALACFSAGWWVESTIADSRLRNELAAQEARLIGECKDLQKTTKDANDGLQKQFDIIKHKLAQRVQSRCIVPASSGSNVAGVDGKPTGQNGISAEWLWQYAAECEAIRQTFISCRDFTKAERK